jgi:hypothetical protein
MKQTRFVKQLILLASLCLSSASAFAAPKTVISSSPQGPVPVISEKSQTLIQNTADELKPSRFAKGSFQVIRRVVDFDPAVGIPSMSSAVVCKQTVDVGIYDALGKSSYWISGQTFACEDSYQGEKININVGGMLIYANFSTMAGDPPQDIKSFVAWAHSSYADPTKSLPDIPYQQSFTKNMTQEFFGTISNPAQGVTCSSSTPGGDPTDCKLINPVTYETTWQVEDKP